MDSTDYYERYAKVYFENTVDLSMEEILDEFLELLPEYAQVLDLGCGSGRDSVYMEEKGCYVTLLDGSEEMCKLAGIHAGKDVLHMTFAEMDFEEVFDGIWACASLLHVAKTDIDDIMKQVAMALKPGGILYMSVRLGDSEGFRGNRFYCDYTEETAYGLIGRQSQLKLHKLWLTEDVRSEKKEERWVNILAEKKNNEH